MLFLHLRDGMAHEREDAVEVNGDGLLPLRVAEAVDRRVIGRPDAVIGHQNVEASETANGFLDERAGGLKAGEVTGNRGSLLAEFFDEGIGLGLGTLIVEEHAGSSLREETDGGGADAARASGDESDLIG